MDFTDFSAGKDDDGRRLDRIVRRLLNTDILSPIYKAIRKGLVKVNGAKAKVDTHIHSGDIISVARVLLENKADFSSPILAPEIEAFQTKKEQFPYTILFHNEHILIIDKPYGRTVHGSVDSIEKAVVRLYTMSDSKQTSLSFKPGPLHRLDGRTTGVLAFSWSLFGAQWFSENIAEHKIKKTYIGIAQGRIKAGEKWVDFITKKHKSAASLSTEFHTVSVSCAADSVSEKQAITCAEPLQYGFFCKNPVTIVKYIIETGRTHQIRSQSAIHGFPLLGDTAYGGAEIPGKQKLFLHAYSLEIPEKNPLGLPPVITAPLPKPFRDFLCKADCEMQTLRL